MRLLQFLRLPAAFIAANWAGLLGVLCLGAVPAFAGNQKVMTDLDTHADDAGITVLEHIRRTWWRDLPLTLAFGAYVLLAIGTTALLALVFDAPARVFFAGLLVPVYWASGALLGSYIRAAALLPVTAARDEVTDTALALTIGHPLRALATIMIVLATTPVWVLAPLTIACGLSLPAWALNSLWTRPPRAQRPAAEPAAQRGQRLVVLRHEPVASADRR